MDKDIKIAEENLEYLSSDPETQELYFERERALHEKANLINTGIRKGREEGIKEGEKKKAMEIAQSMINLGLDKDTIATATGLEIREIEDLMK